MTGHNIQAHIKNGYHFLPDANVAGNYISNPTIMITHGKTSGYRSSLMPIPEPPTTYSNTINTFYFPINIVPHNLLHEF